MESPARAGEVFNLGNPDEYTINQFADVIERLCGSRGGVITGSARGRPRRGAGPISQRRDACWAGRPGLTWRPGLQATVEWFRSLTATSNHGMNTT